MRSLYFNVLDVRYGKPNVTKVGRENITVVENIIQCVKILTSSREKSNVLIEIIMLSLKTYYGG